jgi:hypothetical protein
MPRRKPFNLARKDIVSHFGLKYKGYCWQITICAKSHLFDVQTIAIETAIHNNIIIS